MKTVIIFLLLSQVISIDLRGQLQGHLEAQLKDGEDVVYTLLSSSGNLDEILKSDELVFRDVDYLSRVINTNDANIKAFGSKCDKVTSGVGKQIYAHLLLEPVLNNLREFIESNTEPLTWEVFKTFTNWEGIFAEYSEISYSTDNFNFWKAVRDYKELSKDKWAETGANILKTFVDPNGKEPVNIAGAQFKKLKPLWFNTEAPKKEDQKPYPKEQVVKNLQALSEGDLKTLFDSSFDQINALIAQDNFNRFKDFPPALHRKVSNLYFENFDKLPTNPKLKEKFLAWLGGASSYYTEAAKVLAAKMTKVNDAFKLDYCGQFGDWLRRAEADGIFDDQWKDDSYCGQAGFTKTLMALVGMLEEDEIKQAVIARYTTDKAGVATNPTPAERKEIEVDPYRRTVELINFLVDLKPEVDIKPIGLQDLSKLGDYTFPMTFEGKIKTAGTVSGWQKYKSAALGSVTLTGDKIRVKIGTEADARVWGYDEVWVGESEKIVGGGLERFEISLNQIARTPLKNSVKWCLKQTSQDDATAERTQAKLYFFLRVATGVLAMKKLPVPPQD